MNQKKPDNVVFDVISNRYDAALKEYPTNVGAPVIEVVDTIAWKNRNLHEVNSQFKTKYKELKSEMNAFENAFRDNQRIYNAKFSFEPVVGKTYHLYLNKNGEEFLSILSPNECRFDFEGSFYLNHDKMWVKE